MIYMRQNILVVTGLYLRIQGVSLGSTDGGNARSTCKSMIILGIDYEAVC